MDVEWSELLDLLATYMFKPTDMKDYYVWEISCCEVEVDLWTGNIQLLRVDIIEDFGECLSPGVDVD